MRSRWAALVLAAPLAAAAQTVELGAARRPGGTVLGRVCLDLDGDGRCGADEPGVAGARVVASTGGVAVAGPDGRFHLLDVPDRVLARDRTAYGGLALVVEGLDARAAPELPTDGAAAVDLAVPLPPASAPPALEPEPAATPPPGAAEVLLAARVPAGSAVEVAGRAREVGAGGEVLVPVPLEHGAHRIEVVIRAPSGAVSVVAWPVFVGRRADGSTLVFPGAPERVATIVPTAGRGGGMLVTGTVSPGGRPRIAGAPAIPGAGGTFAAWAPPGAPGELEVVAPDGAPVHLPLAAPAAAGVSAATLLGEAEASFHGRAGVLVTGRLSGALRARLGAVDVEAGADLDDRDRLADLARPRDALTLEHALEPARTFLTAGDGGAADDRNAARGRLWARLAGDGGRLELGAARAGLTGAELGRFDRALFGAKGEGAAALGPVALRASAFGASLRADAAGDAPPLAAHDALPATGGALYWLSHGDVVPGSEALRVEWRDPLTGRAVRQRTLVRGEDYEIAWASGRVLLARPLSSVGPPPALVTASPFAAAGATLVADYLHASAGPAADDLQGGGIGAAAGPVSLAVHGVREDRPGAPYRLAAATGTIDLSVAELRVEAARSTGLAFDAAGGFSRSSDGGFGFAAPALAPASASGDALHVEVRGGRGPLRAEGWWRAREAGYSDAEFLETRTARERGAEVSLAGPVGLALLWAERRGTDPRDPAAAMPLDVRRAVARGDVALGPVTLTAEAVDTLLSAPVPGEETSAGARAAVSIGPGLTVEASHHQGLQATGAGVDQTFTAAGASLETREGTLAVRGGWGPAVGPRLVASGERGGAGEAVYGTFSVDPDAPSAFRADAGALGARRTAGDAEIFTEEQFARDPFGLRSARVVGARLAPATGLTLALTAERGERLLPGGAPVDRSAAAASAGLVRGSVRAALRGEVRDEGEGHVAAAGGSLEWRVAPPATLSARAGWSHGVVGGREALELEVAVGAALRLARLSALATVARLAEQRPGEARRDGVLARAAVTADAARWLSLGAGAGAAAWRSAGGRDDRLAGSVRARVPIAGPVDAAVEYARRAPLSGGRLGALDAVRVEAGIGAGLSRLALGYDLVGFGGDGLDPAADTGRLYLRVQVGY